MSKYHLGNNHFDEASLLASEVSSDQGDQESATLSAYLRWCENTILEPALSGIPDLVCFSHLRWDFVYQRPQHLLTRCAQIRRVFL